MVCVMKGIKYWLAEHPCIVGFRWSHSHSWGSTWYFLFTSIATYIASAVFLHLFLLLVRRRRRRRRPLPLGPVPALHSLAMALISVLIFVGILFSAAAEIRDTRWFWRRSKTPLQWFFCFPLGTRPSGRVFFWSYVFYLSRFLHLLRTYFTVLRRRRLSLFQVLNQSILLCMTYLWLEFSQSLQVPAILSMTLVYSVVYGYRFWTAIGLPSSCPPFVVNCQIFLLGCNLVLHFGVPFLHFLKGGCNGIGAWVFNSVLNAFILLHFLSFYLKMHLGRTAASSSSSPSTSTRHRACSETEEDELTIQEKKNR